jgi:hypothetical protein
VLDTSHQKKREWIIDKPFCFYPNHDELNDFGRVQTQLKVKIVQISAIAGDGYPCLADCLIRS